MFILYLQKDPRYFFAVVITIVVSITLHELAHGVVAIWRGDHTPIDQGHMTLNPAVHMGPISIVALLVAGIAWGAMPIDPSRLRGKFAEAMVALAGPLSNILLALLSLTALGLWWRLEGDLRTDRTPLANLQYLLQVFGLVNVVLAMFNLIPIPPLDGSKVLENFVPPFRTVVEHLSMTGASMLVFLVAFSSAGKVIFPAARNLSHQYLELLSGMRLVWG